MGVWVSTTSSDVRISLYSFESCGSSGSKRVSRRRGKTAWDGKCSKNSWSKSCTKMTINYSLSVGTGKPREDLFLGRGEKKERKAFPLSHFLAFSHLTKIRVSSSHLFLQSFLYSRHRLFRLPDLAREYPTGKKCPQNNRFEGGPKNYLPNRQSTLESSNLVKKLRKNTLRINWFSNAVIIHFLPADNYGAWRVPSQTGTASSSSNIWVQELCQSYRPDVTHVNISIHWFRSTHLAEEPTREHTLDYQKTFTYKLSLKLQLSILFPREKSRTTFPRLGGETLRVAQPHRESRITIKIGSAIYIRISNSRKSRAQVS